MYILKRLPISINTKILLPFFAVTVFTVLIIYTVSTHEIDDKMTRIKVQKSKNALAAVMEGFNQEKQIVDGYTRMLANTPGLEDAISKKDKKRVIEILLPLKPFYRQQKISIIDNKGVRFLDLGTYSGNHLEEKLLIKKALAGVGSSECIITENGLEISSAHPLRYTPVQFDIKTPEGTVLVDRHVGRDELSAIAKKYDIELAIIYNNRIINSSFNTTVQNAIAREIIGTDDTSGDNHFTVRSVENVEFLGVRKSIGGGILTVMVPMNEILTIKEELTIDFYWILFFVIVIIFLSTYILTKFITFPLNEMLKFTTAITSGDFSYKLNINTYDEFGKLGRAINYMAEKIKERLDEAEYMATVDGLTGLYNHRFFQQRLTIELKRAERIDKPLSLIIIDVDSFKHYNDSHGHPAGDRVLKEIAELLLDNVRENDLATRYGGEEFAIILVDTDAKAAQEVGERIRRVIEQFPFHGRQEQPGGRLTVSMGIATFPTNARQKDQLIKLADDALYKAKYTSKNRVVLYHSVLDELKGTINENEHDLINTIKTLISVINSKDKYTYGHSERVLKYATALGEALNLSNTELRNLELSAYLHDIGKIEISREILTQKSTLTPEEIQTLRLHPQWGAEIISSVESLENVAPIVLHHHECYDGTGYPDGLKGDNIPLLARILKVVDSFDAMTSQRPYQSAKTIEEAKAELINSVGSDFDPNLIEVFISLLESQENLVQKLVS